MAKTGKGATKSEILSNISNKTELSRKQVASVFDALAGEIQSGLSKKGPGVFTVPGLMKITCITKPATKAGTRPNPFKPGEMMEVKAKPARRVVKVRALRGLKDMAK
ncbi:MAG: HU family DNA-binding protein [Phycisphaeraceae bacterium]|nr:HU family DNA-binding protein [Phycisphaeraceae bacterium]